MLKRQIDLNGEVVPEWKYTFLGIWGSEDLGIPPFIWVKSLERDLVERLLEERVRIP